MLGWMIRGQESIIDHDPCQGLSDTGGWAGARAGDEWWAIPRGGGGVRIWVAAGDTAGA